MTKRSNKQPAAVKVPAPAAEERQERGGAGFCIYIGPNLRGLLRTGTIFRGTREDAYGKAAAAIEAQPLVKVLIVPGDALPEARRQVREPGNAMNAIYEKLAKN